MKKFFDGVAIFIIICIIIAAYIGGKPTKNVKQTQTLAENIVEDIEKEPVIKATLGELNALRKAKDYLSIYAFSYTGLIKQLEFEGFSTEEATYGANNCGADWNEQAAKKAKDYLNIYSFSKSGLIKQLEFEGFTTEEAEYGVTAIGY